MDAVGSLRIAIEAQLCTALPASGRAPRLARWSAGNSVTAKPIGVVDGVDFHRHGGKCARIGSQGDQPALDEPSSSCCCIPWATAHREVFNLALRRRFCPTSAPPRLEADKLNPGSARTPAHFNAEGQLPARAETQPARNLLTRSATACQARY